MKNKLREQNKQNGYGEHHLIDQAALVGAQIKMQDAKGRFWLDEN